MHQHKYSKIPGQLRDMPDVGVQRCELCGLVTHVQDTSGSVQYSEGTMHNWARGWGGLDGLDEIERRKQSVLSLIPPKGNHLDFGCGDGELPLAILSAGIQSFGLEPDVAAANKARQLGLTVFPDVDSVPEGLSFDVISLIHVVEHFYDVLGELSRISRLLKPEGVLILETPNAEDALLTRYESEDFQSFTFWSHHPNLCTNKFLEEALVDTGYRLEQSTQIQRYGLANHLTWLSTGFPGGHSKNPAWSDGSLDANYGAKLIKDGVADTIWIVAKVDAGKD